MTVLLAAVVLSAPAQLTEALAEAIRPQGATFEIVGYQASVAGKCALTGVQLPGVIDASSRFAVRLRGRDEAGSPCEGWAWVAVRVLAPTLCTSRPVRAGEPLGAAVILTRREVLPGRRPLSTLPQGAVATQSLPAGMSIEEHHVREPGPAPGEPVAVVAQVGPVQVEQTGTAVLCRRGWGCALLPSGRKVEGAWAHGRLVVQPP